MQDLIDRIPHKEPALLLESVIDLRADRVLCGVLRELPASLAPGGKVPSALGLEVLAQAAAVWLVAHGEDPATAGALVQARDLRLKQLHLDTQPGLTAEVIPDAHETTGWLRSFEGRILDPEQQILVSGKFVILMGKGG